MKSNIKPLWIKAKFPSRCSCGRDVAKGDRILYFPGARRVECETCGSDTSDLIEYEDHYQSWYDGQYRN